jgi:hypothetical protein
MIANISKAARKRRKTIVVDFVDKRGRERINRQSRFKRMPGPTSKRKYVALRSLNRT